MVGTKTDAEKALVAYITGDNTYLLSADGSTRMVYLINGVVYKVENGEVPNENLEEYDMYGHMVDRLPTGVFLPDVSLYMINGQGIIAMEYVDGIPTGECENAHLTEFACECPEPCMPEYLLTELSRLGWWDSSWGNAINCDGVYYLIDFAG